MNVSGKVAIVTGGTAGIGLECARLLTRRGARVTVCGLQEQGVPDGEFENLVYGDLTDSEVRRNIVDNTVVKHGYIDLLVNCAGVGLYASACDGDTAAVKRLFDINLFAALEMVRLIRPHLKAARDATVVNVGSVGGYVSLPWSTMYCASKGALHCLSDGLRRELRPQGIRVISVVPGVITTEFRDRALGGTKPPDGVFRSVHYAISAARMAECIVRGIEKDRKEVVAPWTARGFRLVNSLFPGMVDWYCTRICPPHRRNA